MSRRWTSALSLFLGTAALGAVVIAFVQTWDDTRDLSVPPVERLVAVAALIWAGLICGAKGWLHLLGQRKSRRLASTFYLSQLGKYIPGAIWQPVGQVAMAIATGVPAPIAASAVFVYMLTLVAAGGTVSLGLILGGSDLGWARLLALLGIVPIALLRRQWMARSLSRLHGWIERIPAGEVVPEQDAILAAFAWGVGVMVTTGAAFFVLITWFGTEVGIATAVSGFALAWTIGFLVVPVPAGLGIREAVLVATVGAGSLPGAVIAASLTYRLVSILVEAAAAVVGRLTTRQDPSES